ncbi:MAG: chemotaxis protein CheR [Firmicutes bacterium HGW-Firmicutes-12]|jgi:chemotaxis methyl-accepting protein methylase|nr:MAG: chemotaxis protein CheR [Firmicutes bacterium HGW-Firmicutes-12]
MKNNLSKIIAVMKHTHFRDISIYDQSFLLKAFEKRLIATGVYNADDYFNDLEKNSTEAEAFYSSLHITFSQFFRDSLTFALLEQFILPRLISSKNDGSEIRIWSAGCSSGQEAYSMAMLFSDLAEVSGKELRLRIFATDISQEVLAAGRAGEYDQHAVQNVKMKQLNKYFIKQGESYTIVPKLRQYVNFSTYDLLERSSANPPESIYGDFDIVICSNLLFYYRSDLQQVIINKLQQAMSVLGYLVTGEAEKNLVENITKLQMIATSSTVFENNQRG